MTRSAAILGRNNVFLTSAKFYQVDSGNFPFAQFSRFSPPSIEAK